MLVNIEDIKANGIAYFIKKQKIRIDILNDLLANYDEGRSKSFFCQTCALLPIESLQEIHNEAKRDNEQERNKHIRKSILRIADSLGIDLKLNKKK